MRLINLEKKNDQIASVCKVDTEPEQTDEESLADAFSAPVTADNAPEVIDVEQVNDAPETPQVEDNENDENNE